ncbi:MAG: PAS domain S-box protein [Ignavibacteriaceae bacterium]|nr:PAS domain S-box protein [Ignavibacteriaceae bacterium]
MNRSSIKEKHKRYFNVNSKVDSDNTFSQLASDLNTRDQSFRLVKEKKKDEFDLYQEFFENLSDPLLVFDAQTGTILHANNSAFKLYKFDKPKFIGRTIYELCIEPDKFKYKIDELLKTCSSLKFESKQLDNSGSLLYLDIHASLIQRYNKKLVIISIHKISDRKVDEKELKILSEIVKQSPSTVLLTNIDGTIEYVNQKFTEVTGYSASEVLGKTPDILRNKSNNPSVYRNLWKTIKSGNVWKGEFVNTKKNGEPYWASSVIAPIINDDGEPTHFLSIEQDITDKKELEIELKLALEKANEVNNFKTRLLGNLNHEIRTPLNTIIGFAQLIKEESLDENSLELSSKIIKSSLRLLKTLNSIIELSDLESDRIKIRTREINISDLLTYIEFNFKEQAKEKNLSINLKLPNEETKIKSDERILELVISNLLDNAIKYTEYGSIDISAAVKTDNGVNIFEIKICDTGIGIPESTKKIIFEPFRQSSEGHTRQFEGTGLGLTISQKMIQLLNGKILLESELGKGSSFTIQLPAITL